MGRRPRRPKRKPVEKPDPDHEEMVQSKKSREEEQEDEQAVGTVAGTHSTRSSKLPRKHQRQRITDSRETVEVDLDWPDEAYKKWLHFCCARCTCTPEVKRKFAPRPDENYYQTTSDHYFHKRCCHRKAEVEYNTSTQLDYVIDELLPGILTGKFQKPEKPIVIVSETELHDDYYMKYKRRETQFYNADSMESQVDLLNTNESYCQNRRWFNTLPTRNRPAVVLDLFGGVGSGIMVLKRLKIALSKVIHVDNDKVATHVFQTSHDRTYTAINRNLPCAVVHYDAFEDVEEQLDDILHEHGPIDILLASPPGSDYSPVNSQREGVYGSTGNYMLRLGKLVQEIQQHPTQNDTPLFFMVENVPIRNQNHLDLEEGDLDMIKNSFGVMWNFDLDATYLSPCKRQNSYFTNIPLGNINFQGPSSEIDASCCFNLENDNEQKYLPPYKLFEPTMIGKLPNITASDTSMDLKRMAVFCRLNSNPPRYKRRFISAKERAALMGYPLNYFNPVDDLFKAIRDILIENRHFTGGDHTNDAHHWKNHLDPRFYHFRGSCHDAGNAYQIDVDYDGSTFLLMCPRKSMKFLSAEQYKKRLVGSGICVPAWEHILTPLKRFFTEELYEPFQYKYQWEQESKPGAVSNDNPGHEGGDDASGHSVQGDSEIPISVQCDFDLPDDGQNEDDLPGGHEDVLYRSSMEERNTEDELSVKDKRNEDPGGLTVDSAAAAAGQTNLLESEFEPENGEENNQANPVCFVTYTFTAKNLPTRIRIRDLLDIEETFVVQKVERHQNPRSTIATVDVPKERVERGFPPNPWNMKGYDMHYQLVDQHNVEAEAVEQAAAETEQIATEKRLITTATEKRLITIDLENVELPTTKKTSITIDLEEDVQKQALETQTMPCQMRQDSQRPRIGLARPRARARKSFLVDKPHETEV